MIPLFEKIFDNKKIRGLLSPRDKIVIALSGGPDSVFLFYFLLYIRKKLDLSLISAHLNHMIRGNEAERDLFFSKSLSEQHKIPFISNSIDVQEYAKENHLSLEEAARIKRYKFLLGVAEKYSYNKIATAHTLDDLTETFFMRLIRGSSVFGLKSIPLTRKESNIQIIRPLLYTSKKDILDYLKNQKISYMIDSTNLVDKYTRNYIRHNILPLFSNLNPQYQKNILKISHQIEELEIYMEREIEERFSDIIKHLPNVPMVKLDLSKFSLLPIFLKTALLKKAMVFLSGTSKGIYSEHINSLLEISSKSGEKDYYLPYGIKVKKSYDFLYLYIKDPLLFRKVNDFSYRLELGTKIHLKEIGVEVITSTLKDLKRESSFDIIYKLPYNILNQDIILRNRRHGDRIGNKKLKKFFIDNKIPRYLRDKIPILATGSKVLALIGIPQDMKEISQGSRDIIVGIKFERGGVLWSELWKKFLFQKKRYKNV